MSFYKKGIRHPSSRRALLLQKTLEIRFFRMPSENLNWYEKHVNCYEICSSVLYGVFDLWETHNPVTLT